ncbi:MAG: hypothetical protein M0Z54_15030 [Thermaerobacter sp.]|nr:hypothetical protein [Thermaerobacter sp.]
MKGRVGRLAGAVLGAWAALALMAAPFLLHFQPTGAGWTPATTTSEWMGALAALWALAIGVTAFTGVRPALTGRQPLQANLAPPPRAAPPSQQLEQLARMTLDELGPRPPSGAPRAGDP